MAEIDCEWKVMIYLCCIGWGINFFDTSEAHGGGYLEEPLGRTLAKKVRRGNYCQQSLYWTF